MDSSWARLDATRDHMNGPIASNTVNPWLVRVVCALACGLVATSGVRAQDADTSSTPSIGSEAVPPAPGADVSPTPEGQAPPVPEPPAVSAPEPPRSYSDARPPAPPPQTVAVGLSPLVVPELAQLETERRSIGLGGPITLLSVGGGGALLFGFSAIAVSMDRSADEGGGVALLATLGVVGVVLAIVGAVMLANRLSRRRELDTRIEELRLRLGPTAPPPLAHVTWVATSTARLTFPF